jgi:hypothetical protein
MTKSGAALLAGSALFLALAVTQPAYAYSSAYEFLKSVGCSRLPLAACDTLDPENARNIYASHKFQLRQAFCGSGNINAARQLYDLGDAPSPAECRYLLQN